MQRFNVPASPLPDEADGLPASAQRLVELGQLLSDRSRTLREALTELRGSMAPTPRKGLAALLLGKTRVSEQEAP